MKKRPVVLYLVGSFNPVTIYHLRMLDLAEHHLRGTENCEIVVSYISPVHDDYGKAELIHSSHRINMLQNAVRDRLNTFVDTWEASQEQYSKTVTVLAHVKKDICAKNSGLENVF